MSFVIEQIQLAYDWLRALHIIAFIAWMAGLLYLPRLFVYHAETQTGSDTSETFKVMERKLLRIIMNPAMIATWLFGILMLAGNTALLEQGWFHVKLLAVFLLTVMHMVFAYWRRVFAQDQNRHSSRYYRFMNEVPTLLMITIVIMGVIEPF